MKPTDIEADLRSDRTDSGRDRGSPDREPHQASAPVRGAPLVSVIMIFLDAERFIREAIESVFAQTSTSWELLLVDDGSTDSSSRIARGFADRHPGRVTYLQHTSGANRGMSASRNLGLRHSRGDYICFLDADDVFLPEKLSRQAAILNANPSAGMIYGPTLMWHSWQRSATRRPHDYLRTLGVPPGTLMEPPRLLPLFLSRQAATPGTCGIMVRRDAAERVGEFEEEFRGMYEDQVFLYKLCCSVPVYVEGTCGDLYRQTTDSHSHRMRLLGLYLDFGPNEAYGRFLRWLERYLGNRDFTDAAVWSALRRELRPYRSRAHFAFYRAVSVLLLPVEKVRRITRRLRGAGTERSASALAAAYSMSASERG
jgi:glycosyltransferase involved in cell wall biosynthesis